MKCEEKRLPELFLFMGELQQTECYMHSEYHELGTGSWQSIILRFRRAAALEDEYWKLLAARCACCMSGWGWNKTQVQLNIAGRNPFGMSWCKLCRIKLYITYSTYCTSGPPKIWALFALKQSRLASSCRNCADWIICLNTKIRADRTTVCCIFFAQALMHLVHYVPHAVIHQVVISRILFRG